MINQRRFSHNQTAEEMKEIIDLEALFEQQINANPWACECRYCPQSKTVFDRNLLSILNNSERIDALRSIVAIDLSNSLDLRDSFKAVIDTFKLMPSLRDANLRNTNKSPEQIVAILKWAWFSRTLEKLNLVEDYSQNIQDFKDLQKLEDKMLDILKNNDSIYSLILLDNK